MDKRRVSIIIPVIRPEKADKCVAALRRDLSFSDFEIVTEEDENRIGCPKMVKRLVKRARHDWIMFLGDDTIPQHCMVANAFAAVAKLPDSWGLVGLNDQFQDGWQVATHWMAHRRLLSWLGEEFFHTGYYHCFCDVELTERCKDMEKYVFAENARLIHDHPMISKEPMTEDYAYAYREDRYLHDLILYRRRKRDGWR